MGHLKQNDFTLSEIVVMLVVLVSITVGVMFTIADAIHNTPPITVIEITHDGVRCTVDGSTVDCNTLEPSIDNKESVYFPTGILVP